MILDPARRAEILALQRTFEAEPAHVEQVARLSLELRIQLQELPPFVSLPSESAQWLEAAALLHDIGWAVAPEGKGHHKASAQLIREHHWSHWSPHEVELVALIARYHRKTPPCDSHSAFSALPPTGQECVRTLASLLRVADGLDRRHLARVASVRVSFEPRQIAVILCPSVAGDDLKEEINGASKKSDLAVETFGKTWDFRVSPPPVTGPKSIAPS